MCLGVGPGPVGTPDQPACGDPDRVPGTGGVRRRGDQNGPEDLRRCTVDRPDRSGEGLWGLSSTHSRGMG